MSRVTLGLFAAVAVTLTTVGSADAGCCRSSWSYAVQPQFVVVQPAPQLVTVVPPPMVVQVQQPPIVVQQVQPVVQQFVVDQGPFYSGPNLTDYWPAAYYEPRRVRAYPYVDGSRWHVRRAHHHRRHWHAHRQHRWHGGYPLRRYY